MTSHDVIAYLRRVTEIKQIGHAGTLDPFAEGVLPVCIGKATRLIEYLEDDKVYTGEFCFGKSTATFDIEGEITEEFHQKIEEEDVIAGLKRFEGEIEQLPPIYSAVKIHGRKLYEYAREGKHVEIKPRKVFIKQIRLISFSDNRAKVYIECSKGTYIRSIANELGKILNNGCYLSELVRERAGRFCIDNAVKLENIKTVNDVSKLLINPLEYLPYPKLELREDEYERISHGMSIHNRLNTDDGIVILKKNNIIVAIAQITPNNLRTEKVFI